MLASGCYQWVMLALLWLVYASFGLVNGSMGVLVTPIVNDLRLNHSEMGMVLGSWQLVFIVASIAAGNVIDRWGVRKSMLIGIAIVVFSAGLRSVAVGFATILLAVAIFGAGMPMISVGGQKAVALWFQGPRRGIAVGLLLTGAWAGGVIALSLTNSVVMPLADNSWRAAFLAYGGVVLAVGILWWFLARDKEATASGRRPGAFKTLGQIVRIRNVQLVMIVGLVALATSHGIMSWLPRILENAGMSPAEAGYAASANMLAGLPVVLILPRVTPQRLRGLVLAVGALVAALALCGLIATAGAVQWASLIVVGVAGSAYLPFLVLILMDSPEIPAEYLGSANGVFMSVAQIGGFVAPLMVGALHDLTGGFLAGVLVNAGLNVLAIPVTLRLNAGTTKAVLRQPAA